jgi:transposase
MSCASLDWMSPSTSQIRTARPGIYPVKDHPRCAGRSMKPRNTPDSRPVPTAPNTSRPPRGSAATACLALARKLLKRSRHILIDLGDQALAPVAD